MILLGLFIEDIQMFLIRNPNVNLLAIVKSVVDICMRDESNSYLKGRALWCVTTCSECLFQSKSPDNVELYNTVVGLAM